MPASFSANPAVINGSYTPQFFVSNGDFALFVEGFTSDNFTEWKLRVAVLLPNGQPDMRTVQDLLLVDMLGLDELIDRIHVRDIPGLTWMIGNTQRCCQGMPILRKGVAWTQR